MEIIYDLSSGKNTPVLKPFLADGEGTDIFLGSLVESPDISGATGLGAVERILTDDNPEDVVGLCTELLDVSVDGEWVYNGDLTVLTNRPEVQVDIRPLAVYQSQITDSPGLTIYDDADGVGTAFTTDGKTDAAANTQGGGWFYDDTSEQLRFIYDNDAANSLLITTATTVAITNAQNRNFVFVPPRLYGSGANQGATLNASSTQFGLDTDETVLWMIVVDLYVQLSKKQGPERLNPGIHDAAATSSAVIFADIVLKNHAFNVGD